MKHRSTREMFDYWNRQRGLRRVPSRFDVTAADMRNILADAFILAADFTDELRFRLAGTGICALFAREIKGESFNSLWSDASGDQIDALLSPVVDENEGIVAGVLGHNEVGAGIELELLLLPLALDRRTRARALGILAPLHPPYWLGQHPVTQLEVRTLRNLGTKSGLGHMDFGLRKNEPRTRHSFLVYSGGRELRPDKGAG